MFNESLAKVEEAKRNLIATESSLLEARAARDELTDDITNARRRLERKKTSDAFPTRAANGIIRAFKKEKIMSNILVTQITLAIEESSSEFDNTVYKKALYNVANKQDIFKMIFNGSGWSIKVTPFISFEEEAGTLTDWAAGISAYRDVLGVDIGDEESSKGVKATRWWLEHVYDTTLEETTVAQRIKLSTRKAAFWQILNNGSQPLASDRKDNSFNPFPTQPTDFIGESESLIRTEFMIYFDVERNRWMEEIQLLEEEIDKAVGIRDSFTQDLHNLTPDVRINKRVLASLGEKAKYADENKLAEAIRKYRAGEEFERPVIELTRSGSKGKRARLSYQKFQGIMDEF